jgi:hypothetical protein
VRGLPAKIFTKFKWFHRTGALAHSATGFTLFWGLGSRGPSAAAHAHFYTVALLHSSIGFTHSRTVALPHRNERWVYCVPNKIAIERERGGDSRAIASEPPGSRSPGASLRYIIAVVGGMITTIEGAAAYFIARGWIKTDRGRFAIRLRDTIDQKGSSGSSAGARCTRAVATTGFKRTAPTLW